MPRKRRHVVTLMSERLMSERGEPLAEVPVEGNFSVIVCAVVRGRLKLTDVQHFEGPNAWRHLPGPPR